ncbi:MAG TPA: hypothetical protein VIY48_18470 [Candidatus Paceibacterota bacterium]
MRWILGIAGIALLGGVGAYFLFKPSSAVLQEAGQTLATSTPLTQGYSNTTYRFTLMMPEGFKAQESTDPQTSSDVITLQNQSGDGIQILVSPFDEDTGSYILTKERILQDIPGLAISNEQPVNIGTNYIGLAFKSNNAAFDGDSREVWFVFHGNLYQISTYARLDPLLQAIFKTWQFI